MALTSHNTGLRAATKRPYASSMQIASRDLAIIRLVGRFNQASATQIAAVNFYENASKTVQTRVLARLTKDKYLARINRRLPGGPKGGSPQYVYQLGPEGWRLFTRKRWPGLYAVNYHSLAIMDAYLSVLNLERQGLGTISSYLTEPETHSVIAGQDLRPDLHIEFAVEGKGTLGLYIEVDLATERRKQLTEKMERYFQAWKHAELESFPLIVFLVPDEYRRAEVQRIVNGGGEEWVQLFHVHVQDKFEDYLCKLIA
ncbi:hypothetical protein QFZ60_001562 [Arthrobacter sp. B2I5]|uniref:replication-relaxation family protein n=1 Tax=Arthrobacter sp. B2I5 TaxID=3042266 RepID=UPI00277E3877|nr:replication-relaxation family protein [Arthrobacter sp. B2I5]MDQ0825389.1 hypothetical protein [Arthrobacter sp. B2I5]